MLDQIIAMRKGRVLLEYMVYAMSRGSGNGKTLFGNTRRYSAIVGFLRRIPQGCSRGEHEYATETNHLSLSLSLSLCLALHSLSFSLYLSLTRN